MLEVVVVVSAAVLVLTRARPWLWLASRLGSAVLGFASCGFCLGFWVGLGVGCMLGYSALDVVVFGFLVSAAAGTASTVLGLLERAQDALALWISEHTP